MKRNVTIGFDARYIAAPREEMASYTRLVIDALSESAPRYTYLRAYTPGRVSSSLAESVAQRHNIELMEPDGSFWRRWQRLWQEWGIAADLKRGDVELYHGLAGSLPLGLAARNIRSVVTLHNLDFLHDNNITALPERSIRSIYTSWILRQSDRVVAVSDCVKREVSEVFNIDPDKIDVVYPGVDRRYTLPIDDAVSQSVAERYQLPEQYLLSVGAQWERRNFINVIRALPLLDSDIHYLIVGHATPHTPRLKRVARELGVTNRVHFIHDYDDADLAVIYRRARLYLFPSSYEGFATTVAEAMASCTPVVVGSGSSMHEVAGSAATYVTPDSREEMLDALRTLLADDDLCRDMVRRGLFHVSRFRPEVVAYNLTSCYRRLDVDIKG